MPIFRSLDLYPQTGWRDTPWAESPAEDAMVRTARRVCESINTGLADLRLQAPRARTQLLTLPSTDAGVQVLLFEDWLDHNIGQVLVPAQAHEWSPQQRAAALVDGLEAACALLGTRLGWDRAALVRAFRGGTGFGVQVSLVQPMARQPRPAREGSPACRAAGRRVRRAGRGSAESFR